MSIYIVVHTVNNSSGYVYSFSTLDKAREYADAYARIDGSSWSCRHDVLGDTGCFLETRCRLGDDGRMDTNPARFLQIIESRVDCMLDPVNFDPFAKQYLDQINFKISDLRAAAQSGNKDKVSEEDQK